MQDGLKFNCKSIKSISTKHTVTYIESNIVSNLVNVIDFVNSLLVKEVYNREDFEEIIFDLLDETRLDGYECIIVHSQPVLNKLSFEDKEVLSQTFPYVIKIWTEKYLLVTQDLFEDIKNELNLSLRQSGPKVGGLKLYNVNAKDRQIFEEFLEYLESRI